MITPNVKDTLLNAKNIAIVGLSPDSNKDSNIVAKYLQNVGYNIIPIYPKEDFILDSKVYRSVPLAMEDIKIDIVNVFRKSEFVLDLAKQIVDMPTLPILFWMQLGVQNAKARQILEQHNIIVVEDKCIKIEHRKLMI